MRGHEELRKVGSFMLAVSSEASKVRGSSVTLRVTRWSFLACGGGGGGGGGGSFRWWCRIYLNILEST